VIKDDSSDSPARTLEESHSKMMSGVHENKAREFTLTDLIDFFRQSWILVLSSAAIGLVGSLTFLANAPEQFEATVSIQVAQLTQNLEKGIAIGIETPTMLAERLRSPSSYSSDVLRSCSNGQDGSAEALIESLKISTRHDLDSVVNITLRRANKDLARQCVTRIFEMIHAQHMAMLESRLGVLQKDLESNQERLRSYQESMGKMEKGGLALTVNYLLHIQLVTNLTDKIIDIERIKNSVTPARLISPVYVTPHPVSPNRDHVIMLGLLAGVLLGMLIAIGRVL
jgi:uncharacterized protein involved in exopolysaccharide biosynthesis